MGLYSFNEDAGVNLAEIEEPAGHTASQSEKQEEMKKEQPNPDASEHLEKMVFEHTLEVDELSILVEGKTVNVSGSVKDQETREKLILLLGNVQGIAEVKESILVDEASEESHFYTVSGVDSLESISERLFGNPDKGQEILTANLPLIKGEKDLYPGLVLRIPSLGKKE